MAGCCDAAECRSKPTPRYRRALGIALALNVALCLVDVLAGMRAGSVSLLADAVDFFGDSANYALSLAAFSLAASWRCRAALLKGFTMGAYGGFILGRVGWGIFQQGVPEAHVMGIVGLIALLANITVAGLLYAFREGDADMRSAWLCSRNDAIGNIAVMLAALDVFGTGTAWPDLAVAALMGSMALLSARKVIQHARHELRALTTSTHTARFGSTA